MKKNYIAFLTLCAVVFSAFGVGFAETKGGKAKIDNQLLAVLPSSDAVLAIDAQRLFAEALPQVLAGNQTLLTEILGKFEDIKSRTGVDYKQFQQVAVGVSSIKASAAGYDFEPVVLARGQFNAATIMTTVKTAASGKYREEKIGDRTVYVFSPKPTAEPGAGKLEQKSDSKFAGIFGKFLVGLNKEMALTVYDNNTLALGSLARVRETLEAKTRLGGDVLSLVSRRPSAIVNFGAQLPNGLSQFMVLDDDTLGSSLAGIRQLSGSADVANGNATVALAAKTADPAQAKNLKDTLEGLRGFSGILKGSQRQDQKIYGRMLESVKIAQTGNEVTLDLQVPQADINVLVGAKK
ncbi:MAG TPA: hypothetical protein VIL74_03805 [Pyrinomonadaceae bacterium]|jgi:hypothetical protein